MSDLCTKKICTKCGEERAVSLFAIDKAQKSGLRPSCKLCMRKHSLKYYQENVDNIKEKHKIRREKIQADPILKTKLKEYYRNHNKVYIQSPEYKRRREEIKAKRKAENNPYVNNFKSKFPELYKFRQQTISQKYRDNNPDKVANYRTKRRNRELQSVPKWLNEEDLSSIKLIYLKRDFITELTGISHHVDHIHPLVHEYLCGLHVPWNLQILTASDNLTKSNNLELK